jgi:hypothetical protein
MTIPHGPSAVTPTSGEYAAETISTADNFATIARGLTRAQLRTFGNIAIGFDLGWHPKVLAALVAAHLIVAIDESWSWFKDVLPAMNVTRYGVPLPIHIAWCAWCDR